MTLVNHHGVTVAVALAEQFLIHLTEALAVHCLHMHVGDASARDAIYKGTVAVNPTLIEQLLECSHCYRLDYDSITLALNADAHRFAGLAVEQRVVVGSCNNLHTVDALDNVSGLNSRVLHCKRPALDYFLNLQSVASPLLVEEESERWCR